MDKISDSGSDDRRSIRLGGTKKQCQSAAFFVPGSLRILVPGFIMSQNNLIFVYLYIMNMARDRFDIKEKEGVSLMTDAVVIVDKFTGVNYLYVHRGYGGGLTPLLDSEGKPIISKEDMWK